MGDVNKDGSNDVLVKDGWWEAPADSTQAEWTFHKANFGENCAQMYVYDYDGDGDQDVLYSAAHHLGIWWAEQQPGVRADRQDGGGDRPLLTLLPYAQ